MANLLFTDNDDLSRNPTPSPPRREDQSPDIWNMLKMYVQNDARINLNISNLRNVLFPFDDKNLPAESLRELIGASVNGYVRGRMRDEQKLDIVIDYMELLNLLLPTSGDISSEEQTYTVNLSAELNDNDFLQRNDQFNEHLKLYVKLLLK